MLQALHTRCIELKSLCQKPVLTGKVIVERFAFAKKFAPESKVWWSSAIDMVIDIKHSVC